MQTSILILFTVLAALAALIFIMVFVSSRRIRSSAGLSNPLKVRFWFTLILLVTLGIFTAFTIPRSPYYLFAVEQPAEVVHVSSRQFQFIISDKAIDPDKPIGIDNLTLPQDELIEFRVTSLDVNHGFAIYDPEQQLIAQTQAMPGYVNRLRWKFDQPGKYTVYCLEYCGMAHQVMQASFTVK